MISRKNAGDVGAQTEQVRPVEGINGISPVGFSGLCYAPWIFL